MWKTQQTWKKVLWLDEIRIEGQKPNTAHHLEHSIRTLTHGGGSIMK